MEFSSRKKFILTAGILYVIFGVINMLVAIVLLCNESFFVAINDYVAQYIEYYVTAEIEMIDIVPLIKGGLIASLVFGCLSILFGVYFIVISNKWSEEMFSSKKTQYIVMTIISFVLCGNILTLVFLLIALFNKKEKTQVVNTSSNEDSDNKKMLDEIEKLKKLKDSGALTEEEYTELLSKIIK